MVRCKHCSAARVQSRFYRLTGWVWGCRYDGSVRNATGDIIQFLYGEDGMDGAAIESQRMDHLRMHDRKVTAPRPAMPFCQHVFPCFTPVALR